LVLTIIKGNAAPPAIAQLRDINYLVHNDGLDTSIPLTKR
jgi:hypothetical protein